jgi:hypothetical protein
MAYESGRHAHSAEQYCDNLAYEFDSKTSSLLHGKILSPVFRLLPTTLTRFVQLGGQSILLVAVLILGLGLFLGFKTIYLL